ncbi:hypothetical protein L210DRAFT_802120, partial [Boletus edulis BED1]
GFSKEVQPNLPIRHASLPPDHEFQFSRDEDDESAWRNLDNAEPQVTAPGNAVDVLDRHHQVNGHPSAPDPQALTSVPPQPDGMQE